MNLWRWLTGKKQTVDTVAFPTVDFDRSIDLISRTEKWKTPWTSLYGAAIGDICGSIYEFDNHKTDRPETIELINESCYLTDDTVLTAAIADAQAKSGGDSLMRHFGRSSLARHILYEEYDRALWEWGNRYPHESYGGRMRAWLQSSEREPYNSYGNGAAMRISPVIRCFCELYRQAGGNSKEKQLLNLTVEGLFYGVALATSPTHNHPHGIMGAQATGLTMVLAWLGWAKEDIRSTVTSVYKDYFEYRLDQSLASIRPHYPFDETCRGTVPVAIIAFLESHDFVSAVQNAISVGGDSDTLAAITGSIAEAYYREIPEELKTFVRNKLPDEIRDALSLV